MNRLSITIVTATVLLLFGVEAFAASFLEITDSTHSVKDLQKLTVNGNCFLVGGSANVATLDSTQLINDQTAGDYSIALTDSCKIVEGGVHTYTYALGTLVASFATIVHNVGTSGNMTLSSTGGNFTGIGVADASSFTLAPGESAYISSISGPKALVQKSGAGAPAGVASVASGSPNIVVTGTGSPATGAVTVTKTSPLRSQAGGPIDGTDGGKIIYNTGGAGITLPVHTATGMGAGFATTVLTDGTAATITVTTDTVDGNATLPLGIKQGVGIVGTGGSDYKGLLRIPEVVASSVLVGSSGRVATWQAGTSSQYVRGDGSINQSAAFTSGTLGDITAFGLRDTSAAFDLTLAAVSSTALTAGRTLTFDVVNAGRTVKLASNLTIVTDPGAVTGALKSNGTGTFTQAACADLSNGATGCSTTVGTAATAATGTSGHTLSYLDGNNVHSGSESFGETHRTTYAPTLTSNNYNVVVTDCGKILLLPTGTTPTLTLPNISPASGDCVISVIETTSAQYTPGAASGGTLTSNVNGFTKTKGVGAFAIFVLTTPSVSAAVWMWSGDGA